MKNNLYYIPTIEEFHIGFEYLAEVDNQLINQTYNNIPLETIYKGIEDDWIRVKYLDKEDIESLDLNGFEITEYIEESHLEFTWFKGIELVGLLTFTDKMISFYEYNYSTKKYSDCIFRGTIKNKSELIKLMQQLNVK